MTTTALFVELVVGGIESLGWMFLLSWFWIEPSHGWAIVRSLTASQQALVLLLSYGIGIAFDRLWDVVLKPINHRVKSSIFKKPEHVHKIRALIFFEDEVRANFVEYIRSRMRVMRATLCNSVVAAAICGVLWKVGLDPIWSKRVALLGSFLTVFVFLCLYAYIAIVRNYYQTLQRLEPFLPKH